MRATYDGVPGHPVLIGARPLGAAARRPWPATAAPQGYLSRRMVHRGELRRPRDRPRRRPSGGPRVSRRLGRVASPEDLAERLARHRLPLRRRARDRRLPGARAGPAAAARGRARHRQDRARRGARRGAGPAADPAAVLRGHRRLPGALRLGLPAPDPAPARGGVGRRSRRRPTSRRWRRGCSPSGSCSPGRCSGRCGRARSVLLDRRDRPRRRRVRGVPARGAVDVPGVDPRARHGRRRPPRRSWCSPPTAPARCTTR